MAASLPILIPRSLATTGDPADVVQANVNYVNALFAAMYLPSEIPRAALQSYYVDYWLAQVENGGIAQFIYNSRWSADSVAAVDEGLRAMGAAEQHVIFRQVVQEVEGLGSRLQEFLAADLFGENALRDRLNQRSPVIFALERSKSGQTLTQRNAAYLAAQPGFTVLDDEAYDRRLAELSALDAERGERLRLAQAAEVAGRSPQERAIHAWTEQAQRPFERLTGYDSEAWNGRQGVATHFLAGGAHFRAIDLGDRLLIVDDAGAVLSEAPLAGQPSPVLALAEQPAAPATASASAPRRVPTARRVQGSPPPRGAPGRRQVQADPGSGLPRWVIIVGIIVLFAVIRMLIRSAGHH